MSEQKPTRQERNAEMKAQYLAEQARKKAEKAEKQAARAAEKAAKKTGATTKAAFVVEAYTKPSRAEKRAAKRAEKETGSGSDLAGVTAGAETDAVEEVVQQPANDLQHEADPAFAAPVRESSWETAARVDLTPTDLTPATTETKPGVKTGKSRAEKKADRAEAEAEKARLKQLKSKGKSKGGLPGEVRQMLVEKKLILARWRSRRIEPEKAVEQLTALSAVDSTGAVWRLLPRNGGAALMKTNADGSTEIVEPPVKKSPVLGVVAVVLLGVLAGLAIWSSFDPQTPSDKPAVTTTSTQP